MFDYLIVGAGFSGSTLAERLASERHAGPVHPGRRPFPPAPDRGGASPGGPRHLGLAEIAARLAKMTGVRVHLTTVHRALRRAGWT